MKKLFSVVFCLVLFFISLPSWSEESLIGQFLTGEHDLYSISGTSYVFVSGFDRDLKTQSLVKFIWKNQNDQNRLYICELPYSKVKLVIKERCVPSVKFRWSLYPSSYQLNSYVENVIYAVVTVEKDQLTSNIPLEK